MRAPSRRLSLRSLCRLGCRRPRDSRSVPLQPEAATRVRDLSAPHAHLRVFENSAHFPHAEETERYVAQIAAFLGDHDAHTTKSVLIVHANPAADHASA